ncbi:hypothetical protein HBA54_04110 [Pelagibius litoralis]|uniref:Uncharacterized protein n=1 Tax=Pelagibius litoralis TaxID=374515 RepID=A0A967C5F8_9PROT|nr:hypothetical protein [Pelagibius litoralis]NIA67766.1 hypothetical protein [Pelagibius litoralis]
MKSAEQHFDAVKASVDGTLGVGAVSSPFWVAWLEALRDGLGFYMLFGGAVLLTLRLAIAWRDWRQSSNTSSSE